MMRECEEQDKEVFTERTEKENLRGLYTEGKERLRRAGVPEADLDAWYLLEYVTGISRASYYMEPDREMTAQQSVQYDSCLSKRELRVPLQHITGEQEFMGLTFRVDENVLIPRQDTEILVEEALEILKEGHLPQSSGQMRVLDMCTGSGCVLLSILYYAACLKDCIEGTGVDISKKALAIAKQNARELGIRSEFICGDLFENIYKKYGMILSNPPYIRSSEIDELQAEVRLHEPREALDGKEDGLYFYRRITDEAREYLLPGGFLMFEIGYDQAEDVSELMRNSGYTEVRVKKDLAGLDRVVYGRYS